MKTSIKTMTVTFQLNGEAKHWIIAPGDILLDVLRREGYVGAKRGCETGACGACTVLVNGKPVDACLMFAGQAEGKEILTIEGLAQGDTLHPLQEAFLDHGAVQCGYCTPGMILNAKAFLDHHPEPAEGDVREMLSGNLCRCTGYTKPVEAVMSCTTAPPHSRRLK